MAKTYPQPAHADRITRHIWHFQSNVKALLISINPAHPLTNPSPHRLRIPHRNPSTDEVLLSTITANLQVTTSKPSLPNKAAGKPIGYLPSLDGWRCIAIAWVILAHIGDSLADAIGPTLTPFTQFMHSTGEFGVHIFFGISGFLITSRLLEEQIIDGRVSLKRFYIRRAFRILPPVFAFVGVMMLLTALGILSASLPDWLAALFFFANYHHDPFFLRHFWSLAVEEHFYLIWPALFFLFKPKRAFKISIALAITVTIWRTLHYKFPALGIPDSDAIAHTDLQADGLLWGCAVAFLFARPAFREKLKSLLTIPVWLTLTVLLFATLIQPHWWLTWQGLIAARKFLIPLVIVGTVLRPKALPGKFLELAPLRWVGRLSYSLYLWQQIFLPLAEDRVPRLHTAQSFPLNLAATLLLAVASYYLLERPFIKLGHKLAKPVTPGRPDLAETPTLPAIVAAAPEQPILPATPPAPAPSASASQYAPT